MAFPKITSVFLNLTNSCNLACRYCFVEQNPLFMDLQTAKDAADFVANNAGEREVPAINFFGGEPLLRWEAVVKPLIQYVRNKYGDRFTLSMTSNCTLMTEEIAAFMTANQVSLLFSMDGGRETQEHNRPMRNGSSSFDALDGKTDMILRYFPTVVFRATVTAESAPRLYEDILYAEEKGFVHYFVMPNCFEPWDDDDIETLREQMRRYTEHYIERLRVGAEPIFFTQMEQCFRDITRRNDSIQNGVRRTYNDCRACGKCGFGSSRFAGVNLNGDLVGCQEFFSRDDAYFKIGSIYTGADDAERQRLCDAWDGAEAEGDDCASCPLDRVCNGYCAANNYLYSGDIHRVPPIVCEWNRILFRSAVTIMRTLGAERNEWFKERWNAYVK